MSRLKPTYDDDELKGSVDFDFFADGSESARKNEDDAQRSGRSSARSSGLNRGGGHTPPSGRRSAGSPVSSSPSPARQPPRKATKSPPQPRSRSPSDDGSDTGRGRGKAGASSEKSPERQSPTRRRRRQRRGSADSASSASSASTASSESTSASDVTDVSPLSSPRLDDETPRLHAAAAAASSSSSRKPPRGGRRDGGGVIDDGGGAVGDEDRDEDRINMETIVRALVQLDKQRCQSASAQRPGIQSGSQSMGRIHDIEAENQRLLYSLMRTKSRKNKPSDIDPPAKRPHHSTVNRQKEQRRIEEENRKIFQRLKRVRPTKGMSRDEMITDYKRQASFGLPLYMQGEEAKFRQPRITQNPYCQPVSRVHSSSSMVHRGASSRPGSAASSASRPRSAAAGSGGGGSSGSRGGGGGGAASGRPGWPAGW